MPDSAVLMRGTQHFREGMRIFVNRVDESFDLHYHAHDFIEISYVAGGSGFHHIGGKVLPVAKGDVFLLPVGTSHVFRPRSADRRQKLTVYNCIFTEDLFGEAAAAVDDVNLVETLGLTAQANQGEPSGRDGRPPEWYGLRDGNLTLEPLFEAMWEEHEAEREGYRAVLFALLVQLLVKLCRARAAGAIDAGAGRKRAGRDPIDAAVDYVRRHAAEPLTIETAANFAGLSARHFYRLFKRRTGQSFHRFVQHARIQMSCELLAHTAHKVAAVAETVGYRDLPTFHRVFKRIVGVTPSEFRKNCGTSRLLRGDD
jgi:AraC family L-rhamnose operon transcriptional activator RhaR